MSNEKIILVLNNIQNEIVSMKKDIKALQQNNNIENSKPRLSQQEAIEKLSKLLSPEEKESFGRFLDAEEARKAAFYGC
ncbi:MAG: hypothetical protein IJ849_08900 [Selenomonadaceae bacterium]|nr:hypothetical protein [Selenomonadaceae bacterium]